VKVPVALRVRTGQHVTLPASSGCACHGVQAFHSDWNSRQTGSKPSSVDRSKNGSTALAYDDFRAPAFLYAPSTQQRRFAQQCLHSPVLRRFAASAPAVSSKRPSSPSGTLRCRYMVRRRSPAVESPRPRPLFTFGNPRAPARLLADSARGREARDVRGTPRPPLGKSRSLFVSMTTASTGSANRSTLVAVGTTKP
jgi:hypothetical protein